MNLRPVEAPDVREPGVAGPTLLDRGRPVLVRPPLTNIEEFADAPRNAFRARGTARRP